MPELVEQDQRVNRCDAGENVLGCRGSHLENASTAAEQESAGSVDRNLIPPFGGLSCDAWISELSECVGCILQYGCQLRPHLRNGLGPGVTGEKVGALGIA